MIFIVQVCSTYRYSGLILSYRDVVTKKVSEMIALNYSFFRPKLRSANTSVVDSNSFFSDSDPQIIFFGYGFGFLDPKFF
jgi:hypothetical protein